MLTPVMPVGDVLLLVVVAAALFAFLGLLVGDAGGRRRGHHSGYEAGRRAGYRDGYLAARRRAAERDAVDLDEALKDWGIDQ